LGKLRAARKSAQHGKEAQVIGKVVKDGYAVYERWLGGVAGFAARRHIHPNAVTLASLAPAALAGLAAAAGIFWLAALLLIASGCMDLVDGALARRTGQSSRFGALLDSTVDRLSDAAVPLGLLVFYAPYGLAILVPGVLIVSGFSISYVRARAEGLSIELPRLWMRREDRLITTVIALLLAAVPVSGSSVPAPVMFYILAALAALGLIAAALALVAAARRA